MGWSTLTTSFRTARARQQNNLPSNCFPVSTIAHCCGGSSHWTKIRTSRNPSKTFERVLANAIFIVRRTVQTYCGSAERPRNNIIGASSKTSQIVCKPDIRRTSLELQREFCDLENKLVYMTGTDRPHPRFVSLKMPQENP